MSAVTVQQAPKYQPMHFCKIHGWQPCHGRGTPLQDDHMCDVRGCTEPPWSDSKRAEEERLLKSIMAGKPVKTWANGSWY